MTLFRATTLLFLGGLVAFAASEAEVSDPAGPSTPSAPLAWSEVLNRYVSANQNLQARFRDSYMDIDVEGRLLRLKKEGSLHALRQVGELGQITFEGAHSEGDRTVVKDVIHRYLTAEAEASKGLADKDGKPQSIAISPDNYKFRFKATLTTDVRTVYIFQVTPRKDRLGLFKGEVWVDQATGMPVRESGRFVKSPSKFLRRLDFVREYEIRDGFAYPVKIESSVDTFLYGRAELSVRYSNYSTPQTAQSSINPLGW